MDQTSLDFLKRLLNTPGPSGFETAAARLWREEASRFADRVLADASGNSHATINEDASPRVMLAGHIDEIGLMVTHVDDDGFIYFDGIGGWDPQVLVGQRVRLLTRSGEVVGVVGRKPVHLMKPDEKDKAAKLSDLWIDSGTRGREEVANRGVRVGDPAVIDGQVVELGDGLIASRSIDNRIGAAVVLEALRLLAEDRPAVRVTAVATAQEEISYHGGGARTSAFRIEPDVALAVDVTFASDCPGMDKKELGDHKLGGGPVISRGSAAHPLVVERLVEVAAREGIPYTLMATPRFTSTDADAIYLSRAGVPTGLISIPSRYMHSPNEIVALSDFEAAARLIAGFVRSIEPGTDFIDH